MSEQPNTQLRWMLYGRGFASFGRHDSPVPQPIPAPGPREVLARVDAFCICASDVKMIAMGNDYPLFRGRDFSREPAALGHELALTVVRPGADMAAQWPAGKRFGIQPDVYLNGERFCIGVNVAGGMAEYILLGEEVFTSDHGSCAFAVDDEISYAAVAQTEPLACVEAAFVRHSRTDLQPGGRLLIYIDPAISSTFILDRPLNAKDITVIDAGSRLDKIDMPAGTVICRRGAELIPELYDDVLIIGNPDNAILTSLTECLAVNGLLCWLQEAPLRCGARADIAKIHYHNLALTGSTDKRLSSALNPGKYRYDYQPAGTLLISGGGGSMGRIHLLRALKHPQGPRRIIVTNNSRTRLDIMRADFQEMATANQREIVYIALQDTPDYKNRLRSLLGPDGASDIVVCAPGIAPLEAVVEFLADDGLLVLFSGTAYGRFGDIPLGQAAAGKATISASSGSSVQDQLRVMEKIRRGEMAPDFNVAAVAGLLAAKEGVMLVKEGKATGKVVVYPQLKYLPLTPLNELAQWDEILAEYVREHGWSRQSEILLAQRYHIKIKIDAV